MEKTDEKKPITKFIIEMDGDEYVMQGGGGVEPGVPLPDDTVDSNAIIDGAVNMEDLNQGLKDKMLTDEDRVTQSDLDNFDV